MVALGSFFAFVLLFAIDLFAHRANPYMGILAYVVAPGFLFLGIAMLLVGAWIHRRHLRKTQAGQAPHALSIDLSRPRDKKAFIGFVAGSVLFLLLTALGSYQTYHYTESVHFCGEACHVPMKPEFTAYLNSPHARVECVECHVGSGATAYVKSKINGVHQLYGVVSGRYHHPIPTPVKNLRPAQETCEQCHWPSKFVGNLDRTYSHFLADETNTPFTVRLLLKVGGDDSSRGPSGGIHWHMNLAHKVEYVSTDEHRQIIPWVRVTDADGKVTEYRTADFKGAPPATRIRRMDCLDCHSRPAHQFQPPATAVDLAMSLGKIDSALPWIKSNAVSVLTRPYNTEPEALQAISSELHVSYASTPKLDSSVAAIQEIYRRNFFPEMKADWRAYPDNIGHKDWAGCFRCHDGLHKAESGKKMIPASDCNSCHTILAQGSGPDLDKLSGRGHSFFHVDAEYSDFSCVNCHTGAFLK
jgi:nitrate/TMAO reductase-like tetraheme cytochrome c subunit